MTIIEIFRSDLNVVPAPCLPPSRGRGNFVPSPAIVSYVHGQRSNCDGSESEDEVNVRGQNGHGTSGGGGRVGVAWDKQEDPEEGGWRVVGGRRGRGDGGAIGNGSAHYGWSSMGRGGFLEGVRRSVPCL